VLYHDDETETFWSQMTGGGVVGPLAGKQLRWLPSEVTSWKEWRAKHPDTTVLKPPRPLEAKRASRRRSPQSGETSSLNRATTLSS